MSDKRMEQSQDEQVLEWLLGQIHRAEERKKRLEKRLMRINEERDSPIGGQGYDPLPRSSGIGNGAASILFKLADIEERIYAQKDEIDKAVVRVMDIIDYLPVDSMGREICEMRHIDLMKWGEIESAIPMSKSQVNVHYRAAKATLLSFPRIQKIVAENREAYKTYLFERGERQRKAAAGRAKNSSGGSVSENNSGNIMGASSTKGRGSKAGNNSRKK